MKKTRVALAVLVAVAMSAVVVWAAGGGKKPCVDKTVEANKAMVRQLLKNNDDKKFDDVLKMVTDDFVGYHHFRPDGIHGPQDLKNFFALTEGTSFPNGHHEITQLVGEGDKVVVTFVYKAPFIAALPDGTPPTNKECEFHYTCIIRFEKGKMAEIWWYCYDAVKLSQQLGYLK